MSALLCNKSSNYGKNMTAITGIVSDAPDAVVCSNVYRFNLPVHPSPYSVQGEGLVANQNVKKNFLLSHLTL